MSLLPDYDESFVTKALLNSSTIENNFKIGQVLAIQNKEEQALAKFKDVCISLENIIKHNPDATVELHFLPLSLGEMSNIYKKRNDLNKALAFMSTERKFLEYMAANKPNQENDNDTQPETFPIEEHNLSDLLSEMHNDFAMPDAEPPKDPQEIVKMFMKAKEKQDEETVKRNLEILNKMAKERQERLANSRWERFLEYVNDHPIRIAIGAVVFLLIFLFLTFLVISLDEDEEDNLSRVNKPTQHLHDKRKSENKPPKMTEEQMKNMQNLMKKLQSDLGTEKTSDTSPDSSNDDIEEMMNKMKAQIENSKKLLKKHETKSAKDENL